MSSYKASTLRSFFVIALSVATAVGLLSLTPDAFAQGKAEGAAKALQKKAIEEDYLSTEFAKAQEKLQKAIGQCGADACSPALRSRLRRDLGVVLIGGNIDKDKGLASFVDALKIDPTVSLDPDTKTKELEQAFADAKKRAGEGAAPAATAAPPTTQPSGDFTHTPVPVQQVHTPIPVYAEYGGEETLTRVIARYKGFGMTDWKTAELKKIGESGWGGLLPCPDVQQGTTQYYLQGFNANNDPVATGGDRNNPYRVQVKNEKVAEPPHLPNEAPPTQCIDNGDCPPDFPGCKKGGESTEASTEPTGKDGGEFCEEASECKSGQCEESKCTAYAGHQKGRRFWLGVSGTFEWALIPSTNDACKLVPPGATPLNDKNYYCANSDGSDYPSRANAQASQNSNLVNSSEFGGKGGDKVGGGAAFGNVRVMLAADYAVTANVLLGARIGYVLNTYAGQAAAEDGKRFSTPIHLEARGTYVIGKDAIFTDGFAPFVFVAGGVAPFEAKVSDIDVFDKTQLDSSGHLVAQKKDAWHIAGPGFAALGVGGRITVAQRFALSLGLRANFAFGNAFAPSFGPEIGGQFGF